VNSVLQGLIQDACCFSVDSSLAIMTQVAHFSFDSNPLMRLTSQQVILNYRVRLKSRFSRSV